MNKEIEEMAVDLCLIDRCKHLPQKECHETPCAYCEAEALYNAGYRKQRVGRWITHSHSYVCSVCDFEYDTDVIAFDYNPITDFDLYFCSVCGAKMEGDENDA